MNESRSEPYFSDSDTSDDYTDVRARRELRARRRRRRTMLALVVVFALLAVAALLSILMPARTTASLDEATPPSGAQREAAAAPAGDEPRHPITPTGEPLPPLAASDAPLLAALTTVFRDAAFLAYVERTNLVQRIVATVDNLPRRSSPPAQWPVRPAQGAFATTAADGGRLAIADANAGRYAVYVRLLESVDTPRLVAFYRRHYPLFQQAYRELGYPDGHFNDRAIAAIDVLMATPSLDAPPRLVQPKVFFQFADRDLEQLPAGQKALLRIGPENAKRVKAKLAEIRAALAEPSTAAAQAR